MFDIVVINYINTNDMINVYRQICPFLSLQLLHYEYSYCAWKYGKSMCYHVVTGSFICLLLSAWKKGKKQIFYFKNLANWPCQSMFSWFPSTARPLGRQRGAHVTRKISQVEDSMKVVIQRYFAGEKRMRLLQSQERTHWK